MADRMLQIERVQISDEGVYVCRVENSVGWREAAARLTVHCTNPRYYDRPPPRFIEPSCRHNFVLCHLYRVTLNHF